MKQSGLLLVVCWISMWEDLSFLQEFYQQNRQPETIRLAVALIMCAVLLPVFGCPLGGSGGYRDGKSVQFVAGQPVGEAVFDQCVGCVPQARTPLPVIPKPRACVPHTPYTPHPTQ